MNHLICLFTVIIQGFFHFSCAEMNNSDYEPFSDTSRIISDLKVITKTPNSRNYLNIETLNFVAEFIFSEFSKTCDSVYFQTYKVSGIEYKNIIGSIGIENMERIVIGAHYDVAGDQEGADDNASGVVGIIELSRLLSREHLKHRIDFVAYSLEEPPFFRTEHMGSNVHAKSLFENGIQIKGMICLDMIGYFNDEPDSQKYPVSFLRWFYGNKGDFITIVQKFSNGSFGRQFNRLMKKQALIKTKPFKGPASLSGVDFSDHQNYWKYGYSAVMITNTAFYRNPNYHEKTDKLETLDIKRMALVIDELYFAINQME